MIQANIINIAFGKAKEYQIKDEKFKSGYKKRYLFRNCKY